MYFLKWSYAILLLPVLMQCHLYLILRVFFIFIHPVVSYPSTHHFYILIFPGTRRLSGIHLLLFQFICVLFSCSLSVLKSPDAFLSVCPLDRRMDILGVAFYILNSPSMSLSWLIFLKRREESVTAVIWMKYHSLKTSVFVKRGVSLVCYLPINFENLYYF